MNGSPLRIQLETDTGTDSTTDLDELWNVLRMDTPKYKGVRQMVLTTLKHTGTIDLTSAYNGHKVILTLI